MKKTIILAAILTFLTAPTAAEINLELGIQEKNNPEVHSTEINWDKQSESPTTVQDGTLAQEIPPDKPYDLDKTINTDQGTFEIEFSQLEAKGLDQGNLNPESQIINYDLEEEDFFLNEFSYMYAFNSQDFQMESARLTLPAPNQPEIITHCTDFQYQEAQCNKWDLIELEETQNGLETTNSETISDIEYDSTQQTIQFTTESFSAFGSGENAPQPVIQEIEIHDVTNFEGEDREDNENLVASGLDNETIQTLELDQEEAAREYRYDFIIENQGDEDWEILEEDELFHEGLDPEWSIDLTDGEEEIWYQIEDGEKRKGGTFQDGDLNWDTSNQGTLQHEDGESDSDQLTASYITETDQDQTETYPQFFKVESTSTESGSADEHETEITKYGELQVELIHPPDNTIVQKEDDRTFLVEAEVSCLNGECGEVTSQPRYNETAEPDTTIPEFDSHTEEPFRLDEQETAENQCEGELNSTEICNVAWNVLPEGDLETTHLLDVESSSTLEEVNTENSNNHKVTIDRVIFMELEFTEVTFGTLDPGESDEAEGNNREEERDGHQINITENSLSVDELWVSGTPLENEEEPEEYQIGPGTEGNLTMNTVNARDEDELFISETFQRFETNIDPGTIIDTFFWIDVPLGVLSGTYTGEITFKANSTE